MNDPTFEKVVSIIKDMKNMQDIDTQAGLIDSGLLDSFDIINLINALEKDFQISIPGEAIIPENLNFVSDIVKLVCAQKA